jgi:hypothetical protein
VRQFRNNCNITVLFDRVTTAASAGAGMAGGCTSTKQVAGVTVVAGQRRRQVPDQSVFVRANGEVLFWPVSFVAR